MQNSNHYYDTINWEEKIAKKNEAGVVDGAKSQFISTWDTATASLIYTKLLPSSINCVRQEGIGCFLPLARSRDKIRSSLQIHVSNQTSQTHNT